MWGGRPAPHRKQALQAKGSPRQVLSIPLTQETEDLIPPQYGKSPLQGIHSLGPRIPLLELHPKRAPVTTGRAISAARSWWVSSTHTTASNLQGRQPEEEMPTVCRWNSVTTQEDLKSPGVPTTGQHRWDYSSLRNQRRKNLGGNTAP